MAQADTGAAQGMVDMKHRNSHFAVGYWSLIRRGRPAPDQSDVDPKALKRLLPFVFLLDARQSSFVYRLAGTTLCERHGGELRGRDYLAQWDRDSRKKLSALLKDALTESKPLCLTSVGTTADCRMVEIETVLMPMTFNAGAPERFLGVAQVLTDATALLGRSIAFEKLVSSDLVGEIECAVPEPALVHPPPRPPSPPRRARGSRTSRGAHLKLVVSQSRPEPRQNEMSFSGNGALVSLLAKCDGDQGGRFSG